MVFHKFLGASGGVFWVVVLLESMIGTKRLLDKWHKCIPENNVRIELRVHDALKQPDGRCAALTDGCPHMDLQWVFRLGQHCGV